MNGFLVVLRCVMDDLPLALCATRSDALERVEKFDADKDTEIEGVWNIDRSQMTGVSIVEFVDGVPVRSERITDLESV